MNLLFFAQIKHGDVAGLDGQDPKLTDQFMQEGILPNFSALVEACGKRMVFVVNGAAARAKITGEAAVALSQHGTVAPVTLFQRTDFASSMIDGRTAQEIDANSRSAAEIAQLWKYVSTQLRKI